LSSGYESTKNNLKTFIAQKGRIWRNCIMTTVLPYLVVAAGVIVLVILIIGIFSLFKGGEFSKRHSNRLMRYRIVMQGVALLLFALFMVLQ
jgi:hypoxia induced protein